MAGTTVDACRIVELPKFGDPRGNLTAIEGGRTVPFAIARAYWIYDVPGGEERGGHAYRTLEECVVALSGSLDVVVEDGVSTRTFQLNRSYFGLYVPPLLWRSFVNFSTNGVCLVLASQTYAEAEYLRDRAAFAAARSEP